MPSTTCPSTLDGILDRHWLGAALDDIGDDDSIVAIDIVDSSKTLAEKVRLSVTVEGPDGHRRTRAYCVKAHLDGSFRNTLLSEARFYGELAPFVDVRTPRAYYTAVDETTEQAMIIMDDVVGNGGRFLNAHAPYSLDTVRGSLGQLAGLHASTWGVARTADLEWLDPVSVTWPISSPARSCSRSWTTGGAPTSDRSSGMPQMWWRRFDERLLTTSPASSTATHTRATSTSTALGACELARLAGRAARQQPGDRHQLSPGHRA